MALQRAGKRAIQNGVDNLSEFKQGNVSGAIYSDWASVPKGRLAHDDYVMSDKNKERKVYVIFSWYTPIAWCVIRDDAEHFWSITERDFSQSTKIHKSVVRVAIDHPGFYA